MVIIDTEVHIFVRCFPIYEGISKTYKIPKTGKTYTITLANPISCREHSGDILVAEMDRADVDKVFLISYNADDQHWGLKHAGRDIEDFIGGREHTLTYVKKYPERLLWFNTFNLNLDDYMERLENDIKAGAKGLKLFPSLMNYALDDPRMFETYQRCAESELRLIFSLEDTWPDNKYQYADYVNQIKNTVKCFDNLNFAIVHGGLTVRGGEWVAHPDSSEVQPLLKIVRENENLFLSCCVGYNIGSDDAFFGAEYPFPRYLDYLKALAKNVGIEKMMWATDWPYTEEGAKYFQLVSCVKNHATFLSEADKELFLGKNAARFMEIK